MVQALQSRLFLFAFLCLSAWSQELPSAEGPNGIENVKLWSKARIESAQSDFRQSGIPRQSSPTFWGGEVVYQIQVDRFNDGNIFNNAEHLPQIQKDNQGTSKYKIQEYRHGGDLAGISKRLEYLKKLGVSTLWITPIFKNNNASYHNYCTSDLTQVDPAFGTNEDFRNLVKEAHKRGLKVVLDIVVNHICDSQTQYKHAASDNYGSCVSDSMRKYLSGDPAKEIAGQKEITFSDEFFPPFKNPAFLNRCGYIPGDSGSNGAGTVFGDFSGEMLDFNTLNYDFQEIFSNLHKWWIAYADVDGFRMDAAKHVTADFVAKFSTEMRDYAKGIGKSNFYVIGEVAGEVQFFDKRLDSPLHLGWMQNALDPNSDVPQPVKNRAQELQPLYSQHDFWKLPGLNGFYDFSFSGTLVGYWHKNVSALQLKQLYYDGSDFQNDKKTSYYHQISIDDRSNSYQNLKTDSRLNWTLLEIHDWPRFAFYGQSYQQMIGAMSQLLLSEGMPVIYYGFEQGFNSAHPGDNKIDLEDSHTRAEINHLLDYTDRPHDGFYHPRHRQDMFVTGPFRLGSTHAPIHELGGVGKPHADLPPQDWKSDPYLPTNHALFERIRALTHLRQSCSPLKFGHVYYRAAHSDREGGLLAFSRIDSTAGKEMLVVVNNAPYDSPVSELIVDSALAAGQKDTLWKNALNGFEQGWIRAAHAGNPNALLSFDNPQTQETEKFIAKAGEVAVFANSNQLDEYNEELKVHLCK